MDVMVDWEPEAAAISVFDLAPDVRGAKCVRSMPETTKGAGPRPRSAVRDKIPQDAKVISLR